MSAFLDCFHVSPLRFVSGLMNEHYYYYYYQYKQELVLGATTPMIEYYDETSKQN
jgi:hypothetical protein